jgi:hypothetical protein
MGCWNSHFPDLKILGYHWKLKFLGPSVAASLHIFQLDTHIHQVY